MNITFDGNVTFSCITPGEFDETALPPGVEILKPKTASQRSSTGPAPLNRDPATAEPVLDEILAAGLRLVRATIRIKRISGQPVATVRSYYFSTQAVAAGLNLIEAVGLQEELRGLCQQEWSRFLLFGNTESEFVSGAALIRH